MKLEVNVKDFLTDEQIEAICEDELRSIIRRQMQTEVDLDRVLSNRSYEYMFRLVQEELGIHEDEFRYELVKRCKEALEPDSLRFMVFRRKDAYNRTESVAVKYLDEALMESKPKIVELVNKVIEEYPFYELKDCILDTIYECIEQKLFGRGGAE